MTTLAAHSDLDALVASIDGTHKVARDGDRVLVLDVELMSEKPDGDAEYDAEALAKLVERTNLHASHGRFPGLVLSHEKIAGEAKPRVGRVDGLLRGEVHDVTGRYTIYGTLRLSEADFRHLLLEGRFPQRSTEIYRDTDGQPYIAMVALLGADVEACDGLPDIDFEAADTPVGSPIARFMSGEALMQFTTKQPRSKDMAGKDIMDMFEDMDDDKRKEAIAALNKKYGAKKNESDEDDDDRDDEPKKNATSSEPVPHHKSAELVQELSSQIEKLSEQVTTVTAQLGNQERKTLRAETTNRLNSLKTDGVVFEFDTELEAICKLATDEARDEHFARMESNYKRVPTMESINSGAKRVRQIAANATDEEGRKIPTSHAERNVMVQAEAQKLLSTEKASSYAQAVADANAVVPKVPE